MAESKKSREKSEGFVHEGFRYSKKETYEKTESYQCSYKYKGCPVTLLRNRQDGSVIRMRHEHICEKFLEKRKVLGEIKTAFHTPGIEYAPSKKIVNAILSKHVSVAKKMKKESSYRYARARKQEKKMPIPLPKHTKKESLREIGEKLKAMGPIPYEFDGKQRYLNVIYVEPEEGKPGGRSVVFMDKEYVEEIAPEVETVSADATFDAILNAEGCYQLYTMMTKKKGTSLPLLWALMEDKSEASYDIMFKAIQGEVPSLKPKLMISDFERAPRNSFKKRFGGRVQGCVFHHNHATWNNAVNHGIADPVDNKKNNPRFHKQLRKLMAIPRLPSTDYIDGFEFVRNETLDMYNGHHAVKGFLDEYWFKQWAVRENPDEVSVFDVDDATNNGLETYNKQLPTYVGKHSELTPFMGGLIYHMKDVLLDYERAKEGEDHVPRKSPAQKARNERIREATEAFKADHDVGQFLDKCSYFRGEDADGYVPKDFEPIFITKGNYQKRKFQVQMLTLQQKTGTTYRKVSGEDVYNAPIVLIGDHPDVCISEESGEFLCSNAARQVLCRRSNLAASNLLTRDNRMVELTNQTAENEWSDIEMDNQDSF